MDQLQMDDRTEMEDLPLSVMEAGCGQPAPNQPPSTSENGAVSGVGGGTGTSTGNGSSDSNSSESSRSAHTAVMEEDNFRNLHNSSTGDSVGSDIALDSSFCEVYEDITEIAQGSFGQVMKGKKKQEEKYYAVKIIPRRVNDKQRLLREVKALAHLEHKNIVRYYTAWWGESAVSILDGSEESDSSRRGRRPEICLFIQMELCDTSLKKWIQRRNDDSAKHKDQSLQIFREIIDGVNYIHSKNFIHRDLKPANIFLKEDMTVKIGDFGLVTEATREDEIQQKQRTLETGTPSYRAPEQGSGEDPEEDSGEDPVQGTRTRRPEQNILHYESEVDIFPLGLILFELLWKFGSEMERAEMWYNIRAGALPTQFVKFYPAEAQEIRRMLSQDPKMRPSAGELKQIFDNLVSQ